MALSLDPASIAEALRKNVERYTPEVSREEVGRVIESGDGIARVAGAAHDGQRTAGVPRRAAGHGVQPRRGRDRMHRVRRRRPDRGGRPVTQTGRILSIPVGDAFLGRVVDGLSGRSTTGSDRGRDDEEPRGAGAQRRRPPAREGADVHGHHRDRRDDCDRSWAAAADHRRPPDRGRRRSPSTRSSPRSSTGAPTRP